MKSFKRFIGAWYLGDLAKGIYGIHKNDHIIYNEFFSEWIFSALFLDAGLDSENEEVKLNDIKSIYGSIIKNKEHVSHSNLSPHIYSSTSFLVSALNKLNKISESFNSKLILELFWSEADILIEGEILSTIQKDITKIGIHFYLKEVIPKKTYPAFLAPIKCLSSNIDDDLAYQKFKTEFYSIDMYYNIWQIQDDVSDLSKDLCDKILTSPILYIIRQCEISELLCMADKEHDCSVLDKINDEVKFLNSYLIRGINTDSEIKYFLINNEQLNNLYKEDPLLFYEFKIKLKRKILTLWQEGNATKLYDIIVNSGILERLVLVNDSLYHPSEVLDNSTVRLVKYIERFILKANKKAQKIAFNE